ncbi:hypothetical protein Peur_025478 [Populus x canadensis]
MDETRTLPATGEQPKMLSYQTIPDTSKLRGGVCFFRQIVELSSGQVVGTKARSKALGTRHPKHHQLKTFMSLSLTSTPLTTRVSLWVNGSPVSDMPQNPSRQITRSFVYSFPNRRSRTRKRQGSLLEPLIYFSHTDNPRQSITL